MTDTGIISSREAMSSSLKLTELVFHLPATLLYALCDSSEHPPTKRIEATPNRIDRSQYAICGEHAIPLLDRVRVHAPDTR